jgi:hypothetical protein
MCESNIETISIRCTINYHQDDWKLSLAEFAYNNTLDLSSKQTPFFSSYGKYYKEYVDVRCKVQPTFKVGN